MTWLPRPPRWQLSHVVGNAPSCSPAGHIHLRSLGDEGLHFSAGELACTHPIEAMGLAIWHPPTSPFWPPPMPLGVKLCLLSRKGLRAIAGCRAGTQGW